MTRRLSRYLNAPKFVKSTELSPDELKQLFKLADAFGNAGEAWVAILDGKMAGFVAIRHDVDGDNRLLYLSSLYVDTAFRGKGVGRALMAFVEAEAKKHHEQGINLQAIVTNKPAIALYEKFGFVPMSIFYTKPL